MERLCPSGVKSQKPNEVAIAMTFRESTKDARMPTTRTVAHDVAVSINDR